MIQVNRAFYWFGAILGCFAIVSFMNNSFVHSMIYPAPQVLVPEQPPPSFEEPKWDLDMHGWLHDPPNPQSGQVLLYFHGNGENLETVRQSGLLEELKGLQIPFLVVDYPGYGRSRGKASEQAIIDNSTRAANWLREKYRDHQLILCGWSLGASVAIQTAANAKADGLIALSAWTSLRDVAALHFSEWLVGLALQDRYNALDAASKIHMPALFIHGEEDDLIPASQGKKVAESIKPPARWKVLPYVGHNDLLAQTVVWNEISQFLQTIRRS